jgi:hypothetical protein
MTELRQKIDGILAIYMTTAGLAPQGLDALEALVLRREKQAVEEAFSRCLTKQDKAPVTQWSEVLSEMFPPS